MLLSGFETLWLWCLGFVVLCAFCLELRFCGGWLFSARLPCGLGALTLGGREFYASLTLVVVRCMLVKFGC